MSLYAEYIKEREGKHIIENEHGFMTYVKIPSSHEVYIEDVYIVPEKRKEGLGRTFLERVEQQAKAEGYKYVTGSVKPSAKGSTASLQALLSVGFKLLSSKDDAIFFVKEL
jgi:GNAT superfamily N-acetyltransferase